MEIGGTTSLTCVAYGEPYPAILWSKDQTVLNNDSRRSITQQLVPEHGVMFVKSMLDICSIEMADAGAYSCTADNGKTRSSTVSFDVTVEKGNNNDCQTV